MSGYRRPAHVRWAVEPDGVVLINGATGAAVTLGYPEAAIWDYLTREVSGQRICAMLCVIASCDMPEAEAWLEKTAASLLEAGFLAAREACG